ncbi:bifunctional coenzyme A synthase [Tetranychus urticae]|uniref:Cytidyltransferase-like domain-containing protein n=1 Tax=Tetranychus urticae TaxID=32264 RepID=T1KPF1_TETUR|nr:bifunctional coenzyme A synthase [Tetranychus urticae]
MFNCGLLLIHSPLNKIPTKIGHFLNEAKSLVSQVLYIKVERNPSEEIGSNKQSDDNHYYVPSIYRAASSRVPHLDVRVIIKPQLSSFRYQPQILLCNHPLDHINTKNFPSLVGSKVDLGQFKEIKIINSPDEATDSAPVSSTHIVKHDHVCLGGTFDNLHNGHKVLLSESLIRTNKSMTIGVTDVNMIKKKVLWELIKPLEERIDDVRQFLTDVCDSIEYKIVGITDPFGPAIVDPELSCIVVSEETLKGGEKINTIREEKGMKRLEIVSIGLVKDEAHESAHEEDKISSSSLRIRKLGTLLRKPVPRDHLPRRPYRIGLVGGVCSGKSTICQHLSDLDIVTLNADVIAHSTYANPNAIAYSKIVEAFGSDIVNPDKSINRQKLGTIVFSNADKLAQLNSIVWPATKELIEQRIGEISDEHDIVVVEAALMLEAGWQDQFHQIWVSIVTEEEAIKRLKERNGLDEEEARKRIANQMTSHERVQHANVVFSSQWEREFTQKQVNKAVEMVRSQFLN